LTEKKSYLEVETLVSGVSPKVSRRSYKAEAKSYLTIKTKLLSICWLKIRSPLIRYAKNYLFTEISVWARWDGLEMITVICLQIILSRWHRF